MPFLVIFSLLVALNSSQSLSVSLNLFVSLYLASNLTLQSLSQPPSHSLTTLPHCVIDFGLQKGEAKPHYPLLLFGLS